MSEEVMIPKSYHDKVCEEIIRFKDKQFYDAVHLLDDGTLEITVGDYTKVKRVLVEDYNNYGNLFYEDGADRPQGEWVESFKSVETRRGAYLGTKFVHDGWSCSECSEVVEKRYPNCPYCLARMKGAEDGSR